MPRRKTGFSSLDSRLHIPQKIFGMQGRIRDSKMVLLALASQVQPVADGNLTTVATTAVSFNNRGF